MKILTLIFYLWRLRNRKRVKLNDRHEFWSKSVSLTPKKTSGRLENTTSLYAEGGWILRRVRKAMPVRALAQHLYHTKSIHSPLLRARHKRTSSKRGEQNGINTDTLQTSSHTKTRYENISNTAHTDRHLRYNTTNTT